MQSWQDLTGQPAAGQQQNPNASHSDPESIAWQQGFAFPNGDEHFDPGQDWSQSVAGQVPFQHHVDTHDAANFFEPHAQHAEENSFFSNDVHPQQAPYHGASDGINFSTQYQARQDAIDPNFNHIHPDLYARQGKVGVPPAQDQAQPQPQRVQQRELAFAQQGDRTFADTAEQQYTQPQVLPHPSQTHQQADQQHFAHTQQAQQQPITYQGLPRQSPVQLQQAYQQPPYAPSQANGQRQPQPSAQFGFQEQQQQNHYSQAQFSPAQAVQYQHHGAPGQALPPIQQIQAPSGHATLSQTSGSTTQSPQAQQTDSPTGQSAPIDGLPKKRKRNLKTSQGSTTSDVISFQVEPHIDNSTSKLAEIDSLPPPTPTPEEVDLINKFNKRTKAAKTKFPAIKGVPHLVHSGTVTLPSKSSDDSPRDHKY